jgi:hypothetical protein
MKTMSSFNFGWDENTIKSNGYNHGIGIACEN